MATVFAAWWQILVAWWLGFTCIIAAVAMITVGAVVNAVAIVRRVRRRG